MAFADEILAKIRADIEKPKSKPAERPRPNLIVDLPGEQWKPIPGYTYYEISNMGRIASIGRGHRKLLAIHSVTNRGAKQPHQKVTLCNNKVQRLYPVHNLVAEAFCVKPESDQQLRVSHLDGCNDNNRADNLEWVTLHESRLRAFTVYPRSDVHIYDGLPAQRNSKKLGGNRSLISNRITKGGWCLECASTIPVQKRGKNMETCLHVEK